MYIFYLYVCVSVNQCTYMNCLHLSLWPKRITVFECLSTMLHMGSGVSVCLLFQSREREKTETKVMKEKVAYVQTRGWTNTNVHT